MKKSSRTQNFIIKLKFISFGLFFLFVTFSRSPENSFLHHQQSFIVSKHPFHIASSNIKYTNTSYKFRTINYSTSFIHLKMCTKNFKFSSIEDAQWCIFERHLLMEFLNWDLVLSKSIDHFILINQKIPDQFSHVTPRFKHLNSDTRTKWSAFGNWWNPFEESFIN